MTERLYYTDSGLTEFEATIQASEQTGDSWRTRLDCSAFYPTSGGQSFDTGKLGDAAVIDVQEDDAGAVWHITDRAVGEVGERVNGQVDSERRWRNRQMHTAQHIVSAVFVDLLDAQTVSVHLGDEYGAVELDREELSDTELAQAEIQANNYVRENIPVEIIFAEGDEIDRLPLRKVPDRSGRLRVIRIADLDCSACGGTHVSSTAQVQVVKFSGTEKLRGNTVVRFLSGFQALQDYASRLAVTDRLSRELTCAVDDLPDNIDKLIAEQKAARKEIAQLQRELLPVKAGELAAQAVEQNGVKTVTADVSSLDNSIVNTVASQVAEQTGGVAVLFKDNRIIVAIDPKVGKHAGQIVKDFVSHHGLRGGGSDKQAQIGNVNREQFDEFADALVKMITDG